MWKIFRCKRGENRGFIPGEYSDGGVGLSLKEDIGILINGIRNALGPSIRILEDEEKVVVQTYQWELVGIPLYKKFLEIYKNPKSPAFPNEFKIKTYKCEPTKEVIKVFDALERYS